MTEVAQAALDGFELERAHLVVRDPSCAATREVAARQLPDDARHQRAQALACSLRNAQRLPAAERARAMPVQKGAHAQADELHLRRGSSEVNIGNQWPSIIIAPRRTSCTLCSRPEIRSTQLTNPLARWRFVKCIRQRVNVARNDACAAASRWT